MNEIDKAALYGRHDKHEDAVNALGLKAAHKALDIPQDDMQIQANRYGVGAGGLMAVALAAGIPSALLSYFLFAQPAAPLNPAAAPSYPAKEFDVEWHFDLKDGFKIDSIKAVK